ncbi:MAG: 23S rRNA (pseudouridine(1915)-N(3))-methyltransferase RlmH [Patescibacteria group bacterium]|nr:23S rRNA (pseudouridine(1915)-N(3))-methyltransferase RlmH [Patescibacteria group bacterium]
MKKIIILSIGAVKEGFYQSAILEYGKRLSKDIKLEFVELPAKSFSEKNMTMVKKQESQKILEFLKKNKESEVFLLAEKGEELDSINFSKRIFSINDPIIFVIGGALGLDFEILAGYKKMSLSKMTFLHEMTKVILLEQIYRAVNIEKGKRYHY